MKKAKKILYPICAVNLLVAVWNLWSIKSSTVRTEKLYDTLAERTESDNKEIKDSDGTEQDTAEAENVSAGEKIVNPWLTELQKENEELVGWIKIPDTAIDYPVMQTGSDNDYYLTHDFNKEENVHGAPFLDVNCQIGISENLIIYGHNMKDKTMFQNLMLYKDSSFCESNGVIEFDTPEESRKYQVIFVMLISEKEAESFPYYKYINLSDEALYQGFLEQCSQYAIWRGTELPEPGTELLTLSTCEYSRQNGRLVVVSKKIES